MLILATAWFPVGRKPYPSDNIKASLPVNQWFRRGGVSLVTNFSRWTSGTQMTNREKLLTAFTPEGTPEMGVVSCYELIFMRDHWFSLTSVPWYYAGSGLVEEELGWVQDFAAKSGLEWLAVSACPSCTERRHCRFEKRGQSVWRVNEQTGKETQLMEPIPSGTNTSCASDKHLSIDKLPATQEQIDELIPEVPAFDRASFLADGRNDVAAAIRKRFDLVLYGHIPSPLWALYALLGYEGLMIFLAQNQDLARYTGRRILRNIRHMIRMISALGADAVWIEECLMDQISPRNFAELNAPILRDCVKEIRDCGLKSIYYYCGNPNDRLDTILNVGADALHFEESKKGFTIDIADIIKRINGRCVVFGNLDTLAVLQNGSEDALHSEVKRQLEAGRDNGNRFIMSTGSPVTPKTPVEKVRRYTDITRDLAKGL